MNSHHRLDIPTLKRQLVQHAEGCERAAAKADTMVRQHRALSLHYLQMQNGETLASASWEVADATEEFANACRDTARQAREQFASLCQEEARAVLSGNAAHERTVVSEPPATQRVPYYYDDGSGVWQLRTEAQSSLVQLRTGELKIVDFSKPPVLHKADGTPLEWAQVATEEERDQH